MIQASNNGGLVGIFADEEDLRDFLTNDKNGAKVSLVGLGWVPYTIAGDDFLGEVEEERIQGRAEGRYRRGAVHFSPSSAKAMRNKLKRAQRKDGSHLKEKNDSGRTVGADVVYDEVRADGFRKAETQAEKDPFAGMSPREKAKARANAARDEIPAEERAGTGAKKGPVKKADLGDEALDALLEKVEAIESESELKTLATSTPKPLLMKALGIEEETKDNRLALTKQLVEKFGNLETA